MKRMMIAAVLLVGMVLSASASGGAEGAEQTLEFSCGSVDAIGTFGERTVQLIADTLAKNSDGKLKIKSFPANQLGNPPEMIDQCSLGALDMLFVNSTNFGPVMKDCNVFGMGYAFRSQEHLIKFLEKSDDYKRMQTGPARPERDHHAGIDVLGRAPGRFLQEGNQVSRRISTG